jgi:hypothetical protein
MASRRLLSEGNAFGQRPKAAGETPALPKKRSVAAGPNHFKTAVERGIGLVFVMGH